MNNTLRLTIATASLAVVAGCTTVRAPSPADPFEGFNRGVFAFNEGVDKAVLRPVAKAYVWALPQPVRTSVSNVFSNIGDVPVAANKFLQGDIAAGAESLMRVVINTVFGVGGLFDVATLAKLPKHQADFGTTLGHYGVPPGPYLMLPLLGPSTVRDAVALYPDWYATPTSYIDSWPIKATLTGVHIVSLRASLLDTTDLLSDAALDKYSFLRDAYLQRRQYLIKGPNAELPNYDDPEADGDAAAPATGTTPAPVGGGAGVGGADAITNSPPGNAAPAR
ncbi:MlaA family lipoprotein [Chitinasiproducens palmae]|uniref:Phospholipid-binding lipoprotein MlaA n=1 Tax=Chitinasiproducens palmae TaxID=1770053 RepID=A0A1H2PVI3_9BURK|nr:VacJ family lipoprotein [Chitinasiproducens palmae]SDV51291.1 phospholipid-binding lipoprotein MlaA [Chitinasiproducens palmae]